MTNANKNLMSLEEFGELVDTFGADRTRWPLLRRHRAEALLSVSDAARGLLDEAAALDKVLEAARPVEPKNIDALLDSVVARATAGPRLATSTEPLPSAAKPVVAEQHVRRPRAAVERREAWRAGALMAASLVAGLYLGQVPWSASAVPLVEELAATTFGSPTQTLTFTSFSTDDLDDE